MERVNYAKADIWEWQCPVCDRWKRSYEDPKDMEYFVCPNCKTMVEMGEEEE